MADIRVGDIGTVFEATIRDQENRIKNISAASTKEIIFRKPSGAILTKSATFTTDGSDGKIFYSIVDGDLNESGTWRIQAYVVLPEGTWRSTVQTFPVARNL